MQRRSLVSAAGSACSPSVKEKTDDELLAQTARSRQASWRAGPSNPLLARVTISSYRSSLAMRASAQRPTRPLHRCPAAVQDRHEVRRRGRGGALRNRRPLARGRVGELGPAVQPGATSSSL